MYSSQNPRSARDIWALPLDGERRPFVVVQTDFEEAAARFSPDGQWIAYQSNQTGSTYAATRDGQRFLINTPTNDSETLPITIVLNWKPPTR